MNVLSIFYQFLLVNIVSSSKFRDISFKSCSIHFKIISIILILKFEFEFLSRRKSKLYEIVDNFIERNIIFLISHRLIDEISLTLNMIDHRNIFLEIASYRVTLPSGKKKRRGREIIISRQSNLGDCWTSHLFRGTRTKAEDGTRTISLVCSGALDVRNK